MSFLHFLEQFRTGWLTSFFTLMTALGEETIFIGVFLVVLWCCDRKYANRLFCVFFTGMFFNQLFKLIFHVPRPWVQDPTLHTVESAKAGASVCHVDAAKGMVAWAKENAKLSGLADAPIRWIVDDCAKFVEREIRRGKTYDAIIMDPPSYGRGPSGEVWKLEDSLYPFVKLCMQVLSDKPLFVIINSYTTGLAPSVLGYILHLLACQRFGGKVTWDELGLPCTESGMALPCGATGRWVSE